MTCCNSAATARCISGARPAAAKATCCGPPATSSKNRDVGRCCSTPQTPASAWPDVTDLLAQQAGGLLAVDDAQQLSDWQQDWLFGLYNAARSAELAFLACGNAAPAALPLRTDLRTRLSWGLALRLQAPDDAVRARVLQRLAHERGYSLSPELLHYMLTHLSRDLSQLGVLMAAFDRYALAAQRPATVPLLKSLLAAQPQLLHAASPESVSG
jgi:ATPase involved in DNA replication initiation